MVMPTRSEFMARWNKSAQVYDVGADIADALGLTDEPAPSNAHDGECMSERQIIVNACNTLGARYEEDVLDAARRVVAERDAAVARAEKAEKERDVALARVESYAEDLGAAGVRAENAERERDAAETQAVQAQRERHDAMMMLENVRAKLREERCDVDARIAAAVAAEREACAKRCDVAEAIWSQFPMDPNPARAATARECAGDIRLRSSPEPVCQPYSEDAADLAAATTAAAEPGRVPWTELRAKIGLQEAAEPSDEELAQVAWRAWAAEPPTCEPWEDASRCERESMRAVVRAIRARLRPVVTEEMVQRATIAYEDHDGNVRASVRAALEAALGAGGGS